MDKEMLISTPQKKMKVEVAMQGNAWNCPVVALRIAAVCAYLSCIVICVTAAVWYGQRLTCVSELSAENSPQSSANKTEYDVSVRHDKITQQENVVINEELKTEVVMVRATETQHISHIFFSDYGKGQVVIFNSELRSCFFTQMEESSATLEENMLSLRQTNGQTVESRHTIPCRVGKRLTNTDNIPPVMSMFCFVSNSNWLIEEPETEPVGRMKRQCYYQCWTACNVYGVCRQICDTVCYG